MGDDWAIDTRPDDSRNMNALTSPRRFVPQDSSKGQAIKFSNVKFAYPSRPDEIVLDDFSMEIQPGKKIGLVGQSGCGKSTIFQLLLRFYDINSGSITIDGRDIKDYDLKC